MKKKLTAILAMLLAGMLLCGSASPGIAAGIEKGITAAGGTPKSAPSEESAPAAADEICRFEDMPYVRPDLDMIRGKADALIAGLGSGLGYREAVNRLDEFFSLYYSANTMCTIADIRNCQDLTDTYYAEEYAYCLSVLPEISQLLENILAACGSSPLAARLERDYFGESFLEEYGPEAEAAASSVYLSLVQKESELITQYRSIVSAPTVEHRGSERLLADAVYDAQSDAEIEEIYRAYYDKYNPILGELYLQMLKVRREQAEALGYDSYAAMSYDIGWDRDFSVEEGHAFIESIRKYMLPVYHRCMDAAAPGRAAGGLCSGGKAPAGSGQCGGRTRRRGEGNLGFSLPIRSL
jgi:hypothetical protein